MREYYKSQDRCIQLTYLCLSLAGYASQMTLVDKVVGKVECFAGQPTCLTPAAVQESHTITRLQRIQVSEFK